jgi:hypothetical protein
MSDVHRFAWQGWDILIPSEWDPVRLEGDFDSGTVLLADLARPRVGLRWQRLSPKAKSVDAVDRAMRGEVGTLAAEEARAASDERWAGAKLYVERDPPGRDVFVGYSPASQRIVQLVCHIEKPRRDRLLSEKLLPALTDRAAEDEQLWSVFGLSCRLDRSFRLESHKLLAGDLSLSFSDVTKPRREVVVRQIGVAQLALQRVPIAQWLWRQQSTRAKHYRAVKEQDAIELTACDGRTLKGVRGASRRRRRFFFMRRLPRELLTLALHDEARDRLVIVQSNDEDLARQVAATVGMASE